jgi:hypothetical protein
MTNALVRPMSSRRSGPVNLSGGIVDDGSHLAESCVLRFRWRDRSIRSSARSEAQKDPAGQEPGVNDVTNSNEAGTTAAWTITWTLR